MNKLIPILVIGLLSTSIVASSLPRHLDPRQIPQELPARIELIMLYGSLIDAVYRGDFTGAQEHLREISGVYVPDNVKYIYSRFNELLDKEIDKLNETKNYLDEAERHLLLGFLNSSREALRNAGESLAEAELIHQELEDSSREFSRILGIPLTSLSNQLKRLGDLIRLYRDKLLNLSFRLKEFEERDLSETRLTLYVNASEAFVGSALEVFGTLRSEGGRALAERSITVYVDSSFAEKFLTRDDGSFRGILEIPYIYKPEIKLYAEYAPTGSDLGKFKGSRSNIVTLRLIYEAPVIEAWVNASRLKPLEKLRISGSITTTGGVIPERVYVELFGRIMVAEVAEDGFFDLVTVVPANAPIGFHEISLYTKPQGILAPAHKTLIVQIYKIPSELAIWTPGILVSGFTATISGKIMVSEGRGEDSLSGTVILESPWQIYSSKIENGTFTLNLTIPWSILSGIAGLKVRYIPSSPIYRESESEISILVVNPLTLLIPISATIYLVRLGAKEFSRKKSLIRVKEKSVQVAKEVELPSKRGEPILQLYLEAVRIVEELVGLKKRPSETIREFLEIASWRLGAERLVFAELSYMTEAAVYGGIQPDLDLARYLLESLRRVRHEG